MSWLWMGGSPSHDTVVQSDAYHECVVMSLHSPATKLVGVIPRGCGQGERGAHKSVHEIKCPQGSAKAAHSVNLQIAGAWAKSYAQQEMHGHEAGGCMERKEQAWQRHSVFALFCTAGNRRITVPPVGHSVG